MPDRLRAFVSSRMEELAPERLEVQAGLKSAGINAWIFEDDAGARPETIQKVFLDEVKKADVYVGIFWRGYGQYTVDEYEHARILGKPRFVYEKRSDDVGRVDPNIERDRDDRLQAFLEEIGDVESGITIRRFLTADELRDRVKTDLAAWRARRQAELDRMARDPGLEYESVLRDNVRKYWIDGALAGSLHRRAAAELGIDVRLKLHWDAFDLPDQNRLSLADADDLVDLYFRFDRFQLILGPSGSGKSTLLLQLARALLDRAELDLDEPIPVIFDLSTWRDPEQPLDDWMIQELGRSRYKASKKWSRSRIEKGRIVPLLDGLDEVRTDHRAACLQAINELKSRRRIPGLVVCSSPQDFSDLRGLDVNGAVQIRHLTKDQVGNFLESGRNRLTGLRTLYEERKDTELRGMAHLPLTLNVMSLAYQGLDAEEIRKRRSEKTGAFDLLETYIDRMHKRVEESATAIAGDRVENQLTWLAGKLHRHGETVLSLEEMQPSWLDRRLHRGLYFLISRTIEGMMLGSAIGLFLGLFAWEFAWEAAEASPQELFMVLAGGLAVGVVPGIAGGLLYGSILAFRDRFSGLRKDIKPAEVLRWRWRNARRAATRGFVVGLVAGVVTLLVADVGPSGWLVVPILALVGGSIGFLFGGVHTGIARSKETPNEGIRLSRRSAVAAGIRLGSGAWLFLGLILGLFAKEQGSLVMNLLYGVLSAIPIAVLVGLLGFLLFGAFGVLRNAILRRLLSMFGYVPRDFAGFLDAAASMILLQKVGGTYRFVHRFFLEHFAMSRSRGNG